MFKPVVATAWDEELRCEGFYLDLCTGSAGVAVGKLEEAGELAASAASSVSPLRAAISTVRPYKDVTSCREQSASHSIVLNTGVPKPAVSRDWQ